MDLGDPVALTKILNAEEIEQIPPNLQEKLTTALNGLIADFCNEKSASYRIGDYEQKTEELQNQIQDYELKLKNYEQNVTELRAQLDQVSAERAQLLEVINNHDKEVVKLRKEKNDVIEERDSLLLLIERHTSEEERMKSDIQSYRQQLNNAIKAKCEAIVRIDEIESKEVALQMKERRFEQELEGVRNENKVLRDDINRHMAEIQTLRRDNTLQSMHLDTRLTEKTNEIKIAKAQIAQYLKTIEELNESIRVDTEMRQKQREEEDAIIEKFRHELQMQAKLVNLYKITVDNSKQERDELLTAVEELRRLLKEGSAMYGNLETEFKTYKLNSEQTLEEKDKAINVLKEELQHANDLFKEMQEESVESAISKLAPTAAITSRLMRSDMSLTQLYSLYAKTTEELEHQKLENSKLTLHMKNIVEELHEQAPIFEAQRVDYHKLTELYKTVAQENEELIKLKLELMSNLNEGNSKIQYLESENKKIERSRQDMVRQMACLIQELECLRAGIAPNRVASSFNESFANCNDVISKKLVTFTGVVELISNNSKLLMMVKHLTGTLEGMEKERDVDLQTKLKEKLEAYDKKIQDFQNTIDQKNDALKTALEKCERYKKMFFEQRKKMGKEVSQSQFDNSTLESSVNEDSATAPEKTKADIQEKGWNDMKNKINSLEEQLAHVQEKYKVMKEEYEYYKGEKKNNDKLFQEQFDAMRTELRELTSSNFKIANNNEYLNEQKQVLAKNNANYKQQICALEDRNKNYESTIVKHEQTVLLLKDDVMSAYRKAAAAESESNNLRHENRMLKDMVSRLQTEKDVYNREQQSQTLLLNNLEFIKSNLERSEAEGRIRLEQRLEETSRELAAQRRHFQEEEDSYRERINDFCRQTETAKKRMEDEKQQADKLREELMALRADIAAKTTQIDELSKKLQDSLTPSTADNPITAANKKAREFEMKFEEAKMEIDSLTNELAKAREHGEQFYKMSQNSEAEIKRLHDIHVSYTNDAEAKLEKLQQSEASLKIRISDLEAELMLSNVTEQSKFINQPDQLKTAQEELKNTLLKLTEANKTIRTLRAENGTLTESLNNAETKYTNEMIQHSSDIQELAKLKSELNKIRDEIKMNTCGKETSEAAYEELKISHEELQNAFLSEKEEYEKRVENLNSLNTALHEQIEALTSKLFLLTQPNAADQSLNESGMNSSISDLNTSKLDEENRSDKQLLEIIKFLRKEKEICACKLDIIKSEHSRLHSEHVLLQKKVDELNSYVNQERSQMESNALSASKHEEILRKIETLNAITDSNRILREERNELAARVNELKNHNSIIEEELFPLKAKTSELTSKVDELSMENSSLRTEAMKWRQRANVLVEKSNKNPEEVKRLQIERENLSKMLAHEKEAHKRALDEIATLRTRLENEVITLNKQVQGLNEERRKLYDENLNIKQNISRVTQELMDIKNLILQKEDDLQKANEEVQSKEQQLQESRSKELQLRKIAKRYKDNYVALTSRMKTELKLDPNELNSLLLDENSSNKNGELETLRTQIDDLTTSLNSKDKEMELLQKERDDHKMKAEVNAQSTELLRDCRARILALTDSKNQAIQELANFKKQVNDEATLTGINDEKIASLEKELQDQITLHKETTMRLTRENESLHMRINQLNRQLGLQQSAKPTTSSVAIIEKGGISESSPRTANVKPMSGSATVQQSATVTPWRGSETTPLASIRPISMQSSRTAAILPTSQQTSAGSSSTSSTTTTSSTSATGSNASTGNTALVPPQQQVHTTGSSSIEAIASSSPTSSHTDYMPSTSSASVAVAAIPPMGTASAAESSQEAESVQQPQQNDPQIYVGGGQQQVVALVSPRVEGSSSSSSTTTSTQNTTVPCVQLSQDLNNQQQQPSTSGTSSTSSTVVSSHSRHTPSSSSVTTTQAGCSSVGHKRPRDIDGDSSNADESGNEKMTKPTKRSRSVLHGGDSTSTLNVGDSGIDVDQMPTSSQRDQEDDVVVIVSEDDEDHAMVEADDDEPIDGCDAEQEEGYDYEQDQDIDDNECPESVIEGGNIDMRDQDTNEVDIDDGPEQQSQQCTSGTENPSSIDLSESNAVAATSDTDNNQQSQAISSGSGETTTMANIPQSAAAQWKQASSSTSSSSATALRRSDNSTEIVSSPQVSKSAEDDDNDLKTMQEVDVPNESETATESYNQNTAQDADEASSEEPKESDKGGNAAGAVDNVEGDEDFGEETAATAETTEEGDGDAEQQGGSATQSEIQDNQLSQIEATSEDNEGTDGVSSEGEKQTVEGVEEEGREAEATTSPTMNTRSKSMRGTGPGMRRGGRLSQRGPGNNRPTPIIWQEAPGNSRNMHNLRHQQHEQMSSQNRAFNQQRGPRGRRTMRRPTGGNPYNNPNMRFP